MAETVATQLRLPEDIYDAIRRIADKELRTMNAQIVFFLREGIEKYIAENGRFLVDSELSNESLI